MRGTRLTSELLEAPAPFPVGDDPAERGPLLLRGVHEVVVDVRAERLHREFALLELVDRVDDVPRHALEVMRLVGVALETRRRLDAVLDAVETGRDRRREREVGVAVGTGDAVLDAVALPVPDHAVPAGAVVATPGQRGR